MKKDFIFCNEELYSVLCTYINKEYSVETPFDHDLIF